MLLGLWELLTDHWGLASDLFTVLQHPAPQVIRLVALVLVPGVVVGTLVGVLGVLWVVVQRVGWGVDMMTQNDRWARREFMACAREIRSCINYLGYAILDQPIGPEMRLRLWYLTDRLKTLGIADPSCDYDSCKKCEAILRQLHLCAVRGDLATARQVAQMWSSESGGGSHAN